MIPDDYRENEPRRRNQRRRLMTAARDRSPLYMVRVEYNQMRRSSAMLQYRVMNSRGEERDWPDNRPFPNMHVLRPLLARPSSPVLVWPPPPRQASQPSHRPASQPSRRPASQPSASPQSPWPALPPPAHLRPALPDNRPPNAPPLAGPDMRPPSWNPYNHGPARVLLAVNLYPDRPVQRRCTVCGGWYRLRSWRMHLHATRPYPHGNRRRQGPDGNQ